MMRPKSEHEIGDSRWEGFSRKEDSSHGSRPFLARCSQRASQRWLHMNSPLFGAPQVESKFTYQGIAVALG